MSRGIHAYGGLGLSFLLLLSCGIVSGLPPGFCFAEDGSLALGVFAPQISPSGEEQILVDEIHSFRQASGKNPGIGVLSDEWMRDRKFPAAGATTIRSEGMIPYIRLMMKSSEKPYQKEPVYTLKNIALGKFDGDLLAWARDARSFGSPILIEYGTEVNQWSYPWNGYWNGNEKGPELFRDAYRHIIDVMRGEGASNLIWAYHINAGSQPTDNWNNLTQYYPGDEYCDLVAISLFGTRKPFETETKNFKETMDTAAASFASASIHKPVILITGTDVQSRFVDPGTWVSNVMSTLSTHSWPDVKGLIWLNAAWKNDDNPLHDTTMRLQDNISVSDIFRSNLQNVKTQDRLACT